MRRWRRASPRCTVAIMGLDGAGKTTAAQGVAKALGQLRPRVVYMGWRPGELRNPVVQILTLGHYSWRFLRARKVLRDMSPTELRDYFIQETGLLEYILFFCELLHRYLVSLHGAVKLTLYDRYFFDMWVRIRHPLLARLTWCLIPKPSLMFYLTAAPEVLGTRRQGLRLERIVELGRQFLENPRLRDNFIVIDTAALSTEEVVSRIVTYIQQELTPKSC